MTLTLKQQFSLKPGDIIEAKLMSPSSFSNFIFLAEVKHISVLNFYPISCLCPKQVCGIYANLKIPNVFQLSESKQRQHGLINLSWKEVIRIIPEMRW